jgi:DMSO reductase anchor subunit
MQAVTGALAILLFTHSLDPIRLLLLLTIAGIAVTISTLHLGRPAYAWRALKMWRRSWLSREVLLFTLFLLSLATLTFVSASPWLHLRVPLGLAIKLAWITVVFGLAGTLASAYIYLVPARPSWNMSHTPIDFLLTAALMGSLLGAALCTLPRYSYGQPSNRSSSSFLIALVTIAALAWSLNHVVRLYRLQSSQLFEARASYSLLTGHRLLLRNVASFSLVALSVLILAEGHPLVALALGWSGVLLARYLFFVSVVPLSMALTFVRSRHA